MAIAADLLRWDGFEVVELGADTPADALAGTADRTDGLLAIGLACTTPQACASAKRTIATLRGTDSDVPVLLGGAAVTGTEHAIRLGADYFTGRRGDTLVRVVASIDTARRR